MALSGISVSRLCFGTLTIGPLQANLPLKQGVSLLYTAVENGVFFFDSAASYGTYPYLKQLIEIVGRDRVVIATKSYAATAVEAEMALQEALRELNTDYIDIFLLHEQLSADTLRGHNAALQIYLQAKRAGLIRAVGISTHCIAAVNASIMQTDIDIIHPLYNREGIGIGDGSAPAMLQAISECKEMGKGIYAMKVLGGGHLITSAAECIKQALALELFDSIAIGMQSEAELMANIAIFQGKLPSKKELRLLAKKERNVHIESYCYGCGRCVAVCHRKAISQSQGKALVDRKLCFFCGYCARSCPVFAIKVI